MADPYETAYREGVQAVDDQAKTFEALRSRAGLLFSAAGVATGALGVLSRDRTGGLTTWAQAAGGVAFLVLAGATVGVWWPSKKGRFNSDSALLAGKLDRGEITGNTGMFRELAIYYGDRALSNETFMARRFNCYRAGLVAFALLTASLFASLITGEDKTMAEKKPTETKPAVKPSERPRPKTPDPVITEQRSGNRDGTETKDGRSR